MTAAQKSPRAVAPQRDVDAMRAGCDQCGRGLPSGWPLTGCLACIELQAWARGVRDERDKPGVTEVHIPRSA